MNLQSVSDSVSDQRRDAEASPRQPSIGKDLIDHGIIPLKGEEIRLLVLHPGPPSVPVEGTLIRVSLLKNPDFEALSWAWGDESITQSITLNKQPFDIPSTLASALRGLRQEQHSLTLWVDYLCINQANLLERNHQVQLMGRIYAEACTVFAWLGPDSDSNDIEMDWLQDYLHPGNVPPYRVLDLITRAGLGALRYVMKQPWWNRIWVVQEVMLARSAYLCLGDRRVLWPKCEVDERPKTLSMTFRLTEIQSGPAAQLLRLQNAIKQKPTLLDSLSLFQNRQCTDPRDRVFGVLRLVDKADAALNPPDYTLSLLEVQARLMTTSIQQHQDLRVLSLVRGVHSKRAHYRRSQPSWVPRWGREVGTSYQMDKDGEYKRTGKTYLKYPLELGMVSAAFPKPSAFRQFNASNGLLPSVAIKDGLTFQGCTVDRLRGKIPLPGLCPITVSGAPLPAERLTFQLNPEFAAKIRASLHTYQDDNLHEAAVRTVLADSREHFISEQMQENYPSFSTAISGLTGRDGDHLVYLEHHARKRDQIPDQKLHQWLTSLLYFLTTNIRSFFSTVSGRFVLGPSHMQPGDLVCILFGGTVPFILRQAMNAEGEETGKFLLVGEAYVDGAMDGEVVSQLNQGQHVEQTFELV